MVGAALGAIGLAATTGNATRLVFAIGLVLALLATARGVGWRSFMFPRVTRQTCEVWGKRFGRTRAAALWGLDLGMTFTARFTFSGVGVLAAMAIAAGQPVFGAALLALFWVGRAAPVWLAPVALESPKDVPRLLDGIERDRRLLSRANLVAMIWSASIFCALLVLELK